jgi:hypothetical protein
VTAITNHQQLLRWYLYQGSGLLVLDLQDEVAFLNLFLCSPPSGGQVMTPIVNPICHPLFKPFETTPLDSPWQLPQTLVKMWFIHSFIHSFTYWLPYPRANCTLDTQKVLSIGHQHGHPLGTC